jgi:hypothetical protein
MPLAVHFLTNGTGTNPQFGISSNATVQVRVMLFWNRRPSF